MVSLNIARNAELELGGPRVPSIRMDLPALMMPLPPKKTAPQMRRRWSVVAAVGYPPKTSTMRGRGSRLWVW